MQNQWAERILCVLSTLERRAERGYREPVELYLLYETMLGDSRSDVAVQWDAALQQLRRQEMIAVDHAGYVVLTQRGQAQVPVATRRLARAGAR